MINDLFDVIKARFVSLDRFGSVCDGLSEDKRVYPLVEVWLAEIREIESKPAEILELVFAATVVVAHDKDGQQQRQMHDHLDAIRSAFNGWRPDDVIGMQGFFKVPFVKIESYREYGTAVYPVSLAVRVFPEKFART